MTPPVERVPAGLGPSERVLDLFAVPGLVEPIPGGQGRSVRAGDLVLSPDRDPAVAAWLNPVLARLAVGLDERPGRRARDLRLAVPVPARDGSWVVEGWGASRYEPGTAACDDLEVALAAGRLLHAELAVAVPTRPPGLDGRDHRWARAERVAFGEAAADVLPPEISDRLASSDLAELGPAQLVHADLAGNVLLDGLGAPVVIDVSPAWRPPLWAEAVCMLDAVSWRGAPTAALTRWTTQRERQALLRAVAFRALSDAVPGLDPYAPALAVLGVAVSSS